MTVDEKLQTLKSEIVGHLAQIEGQMKEWNLDLRKLTFIARDPAEDESIVVVSNDNEAEAFEAALKQVTDD